MVFFLTSATEPGAVAVGTAHTLAREELARAGRVEFVLAGSRRPVASSRRFAAPPGRPFQDAEATLRDDFMVFGLAATPRGVRALEPERKQRLAAGLRVRLLGPDPDGDRDEVEALGTVVGATAERIEIELDRAQNLEGWGGAPVLLANAERVVGLVEAAVPDAERPRVLAAPIGGVLDALGTPLDPGAASAFAAFAEPARAAAPTEPAPAKPPGGGRALLEPTAGQQTQLELAIEYPADGASVPQTSCGSFVAGQALAVRGARRRFDVILVFDTSSSTGEPSGADVNGNGVVGVAPLGGLGAVFGAPISDPGDSILAAEVAAARQILGGLDPRATRVGLVAFAGDAPGSSRGYALRKPATTLEPLTGDYDRIERTLDELLATPPEGQTHMAAGVDQATIELLGLRGAYSKTEPDSEKIVFFFTDGQPTLPYGVDAKADNVRAVLRAANRAERGGVRIHSFAIGPEALEGPIAAVEMASRTRGYFTPVRDPGDLIDVVEDVSFANLDEVRVVHAGTGAEADPFRLTADGSWAGFVQLGPGPNPIRVTALAEDGTRAERSIRIERLDGDTTEQADPALPKELLVLRNRLLEDCLLLARERRLEQERARNEEIRRQLRLEIERERARARQRAAEQRKSLELDAGDEGE